MKADAGDGSAVELGVKFRTSSNGFITGIRFYKGANNTGTHVGHLWTRTGTLLATVIGTWLGIVAATRRGTRTDDGLLGFSLFLAGTFGLQS